MVTTEQINTMDPLNPLVSAIIPTIPSREKYLERAIESVQNQTYPNIELIVVNEGLPSNTQRNIGIQRSQGDFIAFLDDDDVWLPEKTEKQLKKMLHNPACVMTTCWSLDYRFNMERIMRPKTVITHRDIIKSFNLSSTSSYMIRRYPLQLLGGFDENLYSSHEYDLALRFFEKLTKYHVILTIPEILMVQHRSENQISENWGKKIRGIMQMAKKHHEYYGIPEYVKTLGLLCFFTLGYVFGSRIYRVLNPMKNWYEQKHTQG